MFGFFKKKTDCINSKAQNFDSHDSAEKSFEALHNLAEGKHDVFGIFLFLAKLDNRFMPREKDAITKFAIRESGCQYICSDNVDRLYENWPKPSIKEFRTMLSNISASEPARDIVKTCVAILGRQSDSNPMAKILMDEIRTALETENHGA